MDVLRTSNVTRCGLHDQGLPLSVQQNRLEILESSPDSLITVEGIVEDIDIFTPPITKAIQCKYHETSETFVPSSIYKPVLQMMNHHQANQAADVSMFFSPTTLPTTESLNPALGKKN
jgi:hypothetical protein